jgi:hypothetical protein
MEINIPIRSYLTGLLFYFKDFYYTIRLENNINKELFNAGLF